MQEQGFFFIFVSIERSVNIFIDEGRGREKGEEENRKPALRARKREALAIQAVGWSSKKLKLGRKEVRVAFWKFLSYQEILSPVLYLCR